MRDEPIPAATLVVIRDRPEGNPELLMVERAGGMAFAAGALVFPGGRIDPADRALGQAAGVDAAMVAAIRETLEETAVAIGLEPLPAAERSAEFQDALVGGADFASLIAANGLGFEPGALIPFGRWVPQFHAVRRFDTMFFIARSPAPDWQPRVIAGECAGAYWLSASEVLERERAGEARLIFPTRRNLERLAQHRSFAAIRADALAHPVEPVTPWLEERDGVKFLTIPDHLGYPVTREPLEGQWRG